MPDRVLKILMLHGHGQSAQIFEPKTRYIRKAFHTFAGDRDITFEFQYLSGILPAYPDMDEDNDRWVWGYGDPSDGEIKRIDLSIKHILDTLDRDGPFVGIVGFSSGAAMAAIITSLLEKRRNICDITWKARHPSLSFSVCLSGFTLGPLYRQVYTPLIATPTFIAVGSHDPVILPAQTRNLAGQCQNAKIFEFPGIHYVPQIKEFPRFCISLTQFLDDVLDPPRMEPPASLADDTVQPSRPERI
ncbi:hypothetical protein N7471_010408 [Penicillium samsonianum]|uniref:uncharacterized protein n=1 Tax=Penicillium samsonianum TaxID=1882272 RepID=UPI002549A571|nr:uncharacterized protein N7471_010408 [Penicillium samsonianum]KAJ6125915.1 hypothetical protein N7471_010408 [Penicillium samsonianum]